MECKRLTEDIIPKEEYGEDAFGIKDSKYHIHAKDIKEGMIPLEMETFGKICESLQIDIESLNELQLFKCYEHIYDAIQITYNALEEETNK